MFYTTIRMPRPQTIAGALTPHQIDRETRVVLTNVLPLELFGAGPGGWQLWVRCAVGGAPRLPGLSRRAQEEWCRSFGCTALEPQRWETLTFYLDAFLAG